MSRVRLFPFVNPKRVAAGRVSAALLGGLCCVVLVTHVFVWFEPIRMKLVQAPIPQASGAVDASTSDPRAPRLRAPFALIARVHHESAAAERFSIRVDGRTICEPAIAGGAARRIDCVVEAWADQADHEILFTGPQAPWTLDYLELATHHGSVTGPLTAFVFPRGSAQYRGPGPFASVLLGTVVVWILLLPPAPSASRAVSVAFAVPAALTIVLFVVLLIVPLVSPFRPVLSVWTFVGWTCLLRGRLFASWLWRPMNVWHLCRAHHFRIACLFAVASFLCAFIYGSRALGASDTYTYVSDADLWLDGSLRIDQPFVREPPWPAAPWTFAPFGYRPDPRDFRWLVPIVAPGLPMMLAAAKKLGGQDALFLVVPLCAALLVLATYGIGRRLGTPVAGVGAAWLMMTSPAALAYSMSAMSDVPVAAAWAGAFYLLLGESAAHAAGAGLLTGIAILIRPNLVPLAAVLGLYILLAMRKPGNMGRVLARLLAFGVTSIPGALAVAAINRHLFGSALFSGYGGIEELFAWSRMVTNVGRYLGWLIEAQTPVVLLGLAAIFVPLRRLWPRTDRAVFVVIDLFVVTVWTIYCAWVVFSNWWFIRFLLPTWPFMMLGIAACAALLFRQERMWAKRAAVIGIIALGAIQIRFADRRAIFDIGRAEYRNVLVAQLHHKVTDPNSVTITMIHAGSIRYYGGRMTLNWAYLEGKWLDRAVEWLRDQGIHTYAALEDWEMPEWRERFAGTHGLAATDGPPIATFTDPGRLMIFDLTNPPASPVRAIDATIGDPGWRAVPPMPRPQLAFTAAR